MVIKIVFTIANLGNSHGSTVQVLQKLLDYFGLGRNDNAVALCGQKEVLKNGTH